MEVINKVKRLDLVTVCLRNYGWRFIILYRRHQKTVPKKKKSKKAKWLSEEALQIVEEQREAKSKGERER